MAVKTNNGKKGGNLEGKPHYDKKGKPVGGIKAIVTDNNNQPIEVEGGEVIINKEASKKHWRELSKINQSAGGGVPIGPPVDPHEADPEEYKKGGKIQFNPNKIPNKWILKYAENIKKNHPEIWNLGGNMFGNQAFVNLQRVAKRGYWLDSEEWMMIKWRSFVARHKKDFRIAGVVAMLKWVDKVEKGWPYMKNLIEAEIKKRKEKKEGKSKKKEDSSWFKSGGSVSTWKNKYNKKYGFSKNASHSLADIAKTTGIGKKGIQQIYNKGIGAYKTNPESVRPNVSSKEQWAYARVYSAVMGGKAAEVDKKELKMQTGGNTPVIKEYSESELQARSLKKKNSLKNIASNISKLKTKLNSDLKSDNEKNALLALCILTMLETSERVGNETSASNGHVGVTGLKNKQIKIIGSTIRFNYVGKSGVEHKKEIKNEKLASALKKAMKNSTSDNVFETSEGFKIKNDTVNRYLGEFDVTAKDLRGYSANKQIAKKLKAISKPGEKESERKKQFRDIVKMVAEKVGHGAATLKKHYLLPELESNWLSKGKVIDLAKFKLEGGGDIMKNGGMTTSRKKKFDQVMDEFKDGDLRSGSKTGPKVTNPKQAVAIAYSESEGYAKGGEIELVDDYDKDAGYQIATYEPDNPLFWSGNDWTETSSYAANYKTKAEAKKALSKIKMKEGGKVNVPIEVNLKAQALGMSYPIKVEGDAEFDVSEVQEKLFDKGGEVYYSEYQKNPDFITDLTNAFNETQLENISKIAKNTNALGWAEHKDEYMGVDTILIHLPSRKVVEFTAEDGLSASEDTFDDIDDAIDKNEEEYVFMESITNVDDRFANVKEISNEINEKFAKGGMVEAATSIPGASLSDRKGKIRKYFLERVTKIPLTKTSVEKIYGRRFKDKAETRFKLAEAILRKGKEGENIKLVIESLFENITSTSNEPPVRGEFVIGGKRENCWITELEYHEFSKNIIDYRFELYFGEFQSAQERATFDGSIDVDTFALFLMGVMSVPGKVKLKDGSVKNAYLFATKQKGKISPQTLSGSSKSKSKPEPKPKQKKTPGKKPDPFPKIQKPKFDEKLDYFELFRKSLPESAALISNEKIEENTEKMYSSFYGEIPKKVVKNSPKPKLKPKKSPAKPKPKAKKSPAKPKKSKISDEDLLKQIEKDMKYNLERYIGYADEVKTEIDEKYKIVSYDTRYLGNWTLPEEADEDDPEYEDYDMEVLAPGEYTRFTKQFEEWAKQFSWYDSKKIELSVNPSEKNWMDFQVQIKN